MTSDHSSSLTSDGYGLRQMLIQERMNQPDPQVHNSLYMTDTTPLFDQIAHLPGTWNRALLYRSRLLHSGVIPPNATLHPDPETGRLTITGFFAV